MFRYPFLFPGCHFCCFFFGIFSIEQLLRRTDVDKDGFLRTVVNALPLYSFGCPRTLESGGQLGTQHKNLHKKAHF